MSSRVLCVREGSQVPFQLGESATELRLDIGTAEPHGTLISGAELEANWEALIEGARALHLEGAEPTLSPYLWEIFDYFGDLGGTSLEISLHTSLKIPEATLDWLILKSHYLDNFRLQLPVDHDFAALEKFLRHGRLRGVSGPASPALDELQRKFRPGFFSL